MIILPFFISLLTLERPLIMHNLLKSLPACFKKAVTGRVACKQIVPKDEKRLIKEGRERESN